MLNAALTCSIINSGDPLSNLGKVDEDELRQERSRLANAENLSSMAQRSLLLLDEGGEEAPAVTDALGQVVEALQSVAKIDKSQEQLTQRAEELAVNAGELARDLRDYLEGIEFNPRRLNHLEDQIDLINRLKTEIRWYARGRAGICCQIGSRTGNDQPRQRAH